MLAQVLSFPEQASTIAGRVDALFYFLVSVTGCVALLVTVLVLYFAARYRRRSEHDRTPRIVGHLGLELFWSITPLFVFLVMFLWGASVYFAVADVPPDAMTVYVVGKQWMWKLQHQEGQREINELHVPVGRPVKIVLTSEDVIHSFFVPAFRIHCDVLPNRYTSTWFEATLPGRYDLFCSQYCGTAHSEMIGSVVVQEPAAFEAWLNSRAEGSPALQGRKLFLKLQCLSCHSANAHARAPVLEGLYGRTVPLQDGKSVIADDAYLRESILNPRAKVVMGWQPIMPAFQDQVDELEVLQLIAYIKSLRPGDTPVRTEEFPPPAVDPAAPQGQEKKS